MITKVPFYISLVVLATVPFLFGAVQPWVWTIYTAAIFAAFGFLCYGTEFVIRKQVFIAPSFIVIGVFLLFTLLPTFPMPASQFDMFSGAKQAILCSTSNLLDLPSTAATVSYSYSRSLSRWLFVLSLVLLFVILRQTLTRSRLHLLIWLLFAVASLEALYGVVQALVPNTGVLWVDHIQACLGDARGTYINRNHYAGYLEMMIPLMLGFALSREDWDSNIGWKTFFSSDRPHLQFLITLGLVMMVLALLFSKSRAGILGFIVGLATFLYLIRSGRKVMPLSVKTIFLAISVLVLFYGLQIGFDPIFARFLQVSPEASRWDFWRDSLPIIAAHPLGTGLGTFEQVFAVYNVSSMFDGRVTHLHNDYLQLLVETGWVGFLALVIGFGWFLVSGIRRVKAMSFEQSPLRFFTAAGAQSGLVSMGFHSFFDFNLQIPANCISFVTLMAIVSVCTRPDGMFENLGEAGSAHT